MLTSSIFDSNQTSYLWLINDQSCILLWPPMNYFYEFYFCWFKFYLFYWRFRRHGTDWRSYKSSDYLDLILWNIFDQKFSVILDQNWLQESMNHQIRRSIGPDLSRFSIFGLGACSFESFWSRSWLRDRPVDWTELETGFEP